MTLVLATRNEHKAGEIQAVLSDGFKFLTLANFPNAPRVAEDANTFAGNATKKAVQLAGWLASQNELLARIPVRPEEMLVLADDSGLEVDALSGAPGVHSARFASELTSGFENAPDSANNAKLLELLKNVPLSERSARFRCVIALVPVTASHSENRSEVCYADEAELRAEVFEGACEGFIENSPRGEGGFGYDPLFIPVGFDRSFAELGEETKNRISHRAQALRKLVARLSR
jgi:XTP/dITP diphosphohydrolase